MPETAPSKSADRIQVLDVIRGIALAGILVINAMSIMAVKGSTPAFTIDIAPADRLLQDLILFFVESKFFTLFSLLFGIGFAIQIQSAERQGAAFLPRISRRMAALFLFGSAHIAFLWDGDILVIYAITGAVLVLFRKAQLRTLKRWIIGLLAAPGIIVLTVFIVTLLLRLSPNGATALAAADADIATSFADTTATMELVRQTFFGAIPGRVATYFELLPLLVSRIPTVLAMFLIGLAIGRADFLKQLPDKVALLRRIRFWGLTLGFVSMGLIVAATKFLPAVSALVAIIEDQYIAGPILCLGYAAALTLAYLRSPSSPVFARFAIVGRMALTNYLMQSLVLTALAYGWGFGLAAKLSGPQVLGISVLLYVCQILLSTVWLRRFAYGPCEWLWRCVTYWRYLPIRRPAFNAA